MPHLRTLAGRGFDGFAGTPFFGLRIYIYRRTCCPRMLIALIAKNYYQIIVFTGNAMHVTIPLDIKEGI